MESPSHASNIESTILPLLSICSLTSEYQKANKTKVNIKYSKLAETKELPSKKSAHLVQLITECQECFEKEAEVLMENHMPAEAVEELFINYKQFLVQTYQLTVEQSEPLASAIKENYDDSWFSNAEPTTDNSTTSNSTNSLSFDVNDFDFDYASLGMSPGSMLSQPVFEFDQLHLCNGPDFLFSDYIQFDDDFQKNDVPKNDDFFSNGKRKRISKESRNMLEALFSVKKFPNNAERKLIADKCQMSPSQVRIWFTNKRARSKDRK